MAQDRQIDEIISDIGKRLIGEPCLRLDIRIRLALIKASLIDKVDVQFFRTIRDDGRGAPRNDRRFQPHLAGTRDRKPITGKERLKQLAAVWCDVDPSVRQHTVHIENHAFYLLCPRNRVFAYRHQTTPCRSRSVR